MNRTRQRSSWCSVGVAVNAVGSPVTVYANVAAAAALHADVAGAITVHAIGTGAEQAVVSAAAV